MEDKEFEEFAAWNSAKRKRIFSYLETQGIAAPQIGDWPAFEMAPHFGIWCVEVAQTGSLQTYGNPAAHALSVKNFIRKAILPHLSASALIPPVPVEGLR